MPRRGATRSILFGAVVAAVCAAVTGATAIEQGGSPSFSVALNDTTFRPGASMTVSVTLAAGVPASPVDAYVVVQLPTGPYLSLQLGGSLVPGIVPIAQNLVPVAYQAALARYTFTGVEPVGAYTWYAVLTRPGTLDFTSPLQQFTFSVLPPSTPEKTRTELSRALSGGDVESANAMVGNALRTVLQEIGADDLAKVARALETCTVTESSATFEVCSVAGDEFRFLMVRDEKQTWRVLVW